MIVKKKKEFANKMHLLTLVFIIVNFKISESNNRNCTTHLDKFIFSYKNEDTITTILKNFDSFDEFENICKNVYNKSYILLQFLPNRPIIVDKKFNLNNIFEENDIGTLHLVAFVNMKGINIDTNKKKYFIPPMITFSFSKLDFYLNNTPIKSEECSMDLFKNYHQLFSDYNQLTIIYSKFPEFMCPFVFMNSLLYQATIFDVSNSFLNKNKIHFIEVTDEKIASQDMLSHVKYLRIQLKYETMTSKILNKYVFKYMEDLRIEGVLVDIQTDLFKSFEYLKNVDIRIENFKTFFHQGNYLGL